jgi:hypothetical protein
MSLWNLGCGFVDLYMVIWLGLVYARAGEDTKKAGLSSILGASKTPTALTTLKGWNASPAPEWMGTVYYWMRKAITYESMEDGQLWSVTNLG